MAFFALLPNFRAEDHSAEAPFFPLPPSFVEAAAGPAVAAARC
eukprot:CAMPEP_0116979200 /NCGR_PEP_ID=MMETSP0467-20121206/58286_1 /TAXON_ID=283647 /ORGANISM="Mesodinium pulex, Strain SPMC105" /LENGTH=42 /DNA_ID= /DNA_START= /DNA_END= /DNA_ORIENTATION=